MGNLKKTSTTRLPQALAEQIREGSDSNGTRHRKQTAGSGKISRKALRKQERLDTKQRKAHFFAAPQSAKRVAEDEHTDSPQRKKVKLGAPTATPVLTPAPAKVANASVAKTAGASAKTGPGLPAPKAKPKQTALEKLVGRAGSGPSLRIPRTQREEEEDAYIAYLEGKLGYSKGKGKSEGDGLDDLFDFTTSLEGIGLTGDGLASAGEESESVGEEDFEMDDQEDESKEVGVSDEEASSEEDLDDDEEEEWTGIQADEEEETTKPITSQSTPGTAYVPPHLRNQQKGGEESEALLKLNRQLKGFLNRMTEQNIASILDSIEGAYRKNRRNDVTSTLTTLIINSIASHSSLLDSFVVLYAAFVSSLHKIVGIEFAAYFVQHVVSEYERHRSELDGEPVDVNQESTRGKECSNLIVLLSELYNFQVVSCVLVYDLIRGLLDGELSEFNVELLLKIVRNSGQQLRQDDPSALKDIIQIVQNTISDGDEILSSRTRFMVETLTNLKNNKLKRNVTLNQGGDAVERMKKFLTGLGKTRHVVAHEPLRVSLQDLHAAETKGKWWLVGAAWGGDPLMDRQQQQQATPVVAVTEDTDGGDSSLVKLARKQGMNTDIRRSIFIVLMSSDDYVDACDRLSQLNLTEVQQREIVRVLLHCCGNEKTYNPYYALVCQHLCRSSHSYKITLQFCLWDFLRDLGESSVGGQAVIKNLKEDDDGFGLKSISQTRLRNVAQAYGWWIARDSVSLTILKPVDFTTLKPQSFKFLKELVVQVFICSQSVTPVLSAAGIPASRNRAPVEEIFLKASRIETLAMGLGYFLTEAFRRVADDAEIDDAATPLVRWAAGLAKETLRTGLDIGQTM